jgi:hypothetical protein
MVLDCAWAKNHIEFGTNQVLEHRADVIGPARVRLDFLRLMQQVVNVRPERLA